jgi:hypothetical protein
MASKSAISMISEIEAQRYDSPASSFPERETHVHYSPSKLLQKILLY